MFDLVVVEEFTVSMLQLCCKSIGDFFGDRFELKKSKKFFLSQKIDLKDEFIYIL